MAGDACVSLAIPLQLVPSAITASHTRSLIFFCPVVTPPLMATRALVIVSGCGIVDDDVSPPPPPFAGDIV